MTDQLSWDEIFAVMSAASLGDIDARVPLPTDPADEQEAIRFGIALNVLLDDLQERAAERRRYEEQLRQVQKMEAVGSLAGGVAHDFNNLLSVILGYCDMILTEPRLDEAATRHDVKVIRDAAQRGADLTGQLLAFSRSQPLETTVVDLTDILRRLEPMIRRLIGEDITLTMRLTGPSGRVRVDAGQVEQVILNLAVNARDAMPAGGTLTIETAAVQLDAAFAANHVGTVPGAYMVLTVRDTGTGMDQATMARAFEPFYTTKEAGKGTGLGLSSVFGIVQQNRGTVWLDSEVGVGTTVTIYLPRTFDPDDPATQEKARAAHSGVETILIAEDDNEVRALIGRILNREGYRVIEAQNPGDALDRCHSDEVIHALLTDVVMPGMSGPDLAAQVNKVRPGLPVLYVSGYPDSTVVDHGVLDDTSAFLAKPITPESLTRKLRQLLDARSPVE